MVCENLLIGTVGISVQIDRWRYKALLKNVIQFQIFKRF